MLTVDLSLGSPLQMFAELTLGLFTLKRWGFLGGASGKEPACQCKRNKKCEFDPCVRKVSWRRTQALIPVFLSGEPMEGGGAWQAIVHRVAQSRT